MNNSYDEILLKLQNTKYLNYVIQYDKPVWANMVFKNNVTFNDVFDTIQYLLNNGFQCIHFLYDQDNYMTYNMSSDDINQQGYVDHFSYRSIKITFDGTLYHIFTRNEVFENYDLSLLYNVLRDCNQYLIDNLGKDKIKAIDAGAHIF